MAIQATTSAVESVTHADNFCERVVKAAKTAGELIQQIRAQLDAGRRARAVDIAYDCIDELLLARSFDEATIIIRAIIQNDLPLPILLSVLTISLPWREVLGLVRSDLVEAARGSALKEGGEEKARRALNGLI